MEGLGCDMTMENPGMQETPQPRMPGNRGSPNGHASVNRHPAEQAITELVASLTRVFRLQIRIWLTQAQAMMARTILVMAAGAVSLVLALFAILFIYRLISCFDRCAADSACMVLFDL